MVPSILMIGDNAMTSSNRAIVGGLLAQYENVWNENGSPGEPMIRLLSETWATYAPVETSLAPSCRT